MIDTYRQYTQDDNYFIYKMTEVDIEVKAIDIEVKADTDVKVVDMDLDAMHNDIKKIQDMCKKRNKLTYAEKQAKIAEIDKQLEELAGKPDSDEAIDDLEWQRLGYQMSLTVSKDPDRTNVPNSIYVGTYDCPSCGVLTKTMPDGHMVCHECGFMVSSELI